jgi:hypothetical protein
MAETKAAAKKRKAGSSRSKSRASASSSKPKKAPSTKAKSRSASKPRAAASKPKASASKPTPSKPQAVLESVEETAKDAGGKVASVASKVKVPLLAGGAALAAGAGGLALGARQAHSKSGLGGISSKDVAKAARKVGDVGAQVGEVALEVRRARQATNGNGKIHRSPIEVVLQGLTQRRPRD